MKNRDHVEEPDSQMELLIEFVNTDMTPAEFIERNKPFLESGLVNSIEISREKLMQTKSYEHEMEHALAWKRHGINIQFRKERRGRGRFFTIDIDSNEIMLNKTKDQIIEIMKCVIYAPYCKNPKDKGCINDLIGYEVLCKNLIHLPKSKDIDEIIKKYFGKTKYS